MIIAVDGPTASGKGTIAKALAAHFGLPHLDTGLLYRAAGRQEFARFPAKERDALVAMGLGPATDRHELRKRYSALVRRYHPDRNGGNRSHEALLQRVVEAYQLLRKAAAFA